MALQRIALLGLGTIGASLGLALRRGNPNLRITGFDLVPDMVRRASLSGAIDRSAGTLREACNAAEVVILATPVTAVLSLLPEIGAVIGPETLVTDVGGTKREIMRVAEVSLPSHAAFVGGHPLTGPLTAGVGEPSAALFDGAVYCLTAAPSVPEWAMERAVEVVQTAGAQPRWVDADEHDGLLAAVSHLPYFAAAALVTALGSQNAWREMSAMAAGGFRSMSAPTGSDPHVWTDVAATNRENVLRQIDLFTDRLAQIRAMIESGDSALFDVLRSAQQTRQEWLAQRGEAPPIAPAVRPPNWMDRLRRGS